MLTQRMNIQNQMMTIRLMNNIQNLLQKRSRKAIIICHGMNAHVMKSKRVMMEAMKTFKSIGRPEMESMFLVQYRKEWISTSVNN